MGRGADCSGEKEKRGRILIGKKGGRCCPLPRDAGGMAGSLERDGDVGQRRGKSVNLRKMTLISGVRGIKKRKLERGFQNLRSKKGPVS